MPLPSFTLDEQTSIYDVLGTVFEGELTLETLVDATVTFTSNVDQDQLLIWEGDFHHIPPVPAKVTSTGILRSALDGGPVMLVANHPGLGVDNLQYEVDIRIPRTSPLTGVTTMRAMRRWHFNAPGDGAVLDLTTVAPVDYADTVPISKGEQGYSFAGLQPIPGGATVQPLREGPNGTTVPAGPPISLDVGDPPAPVRNIETRSTSGLLSSVGDQLVYIAAGTMIMPTAVGNTNMYVLKNISTSNRNVNSTGAQTFDGAPPPLVLPAGASVTLASDTANWRIL